MAKHIGAGIFVLRALVVASTVAFFGAAALAGDSGKLAVGLLPIVDSLPFHVADAEGFFADGNIEVKAIPVSSALERDQLFQDTEIDPRFFLQNSLQLLTFIAYFPPEEISGLLIKRRENLTEYLRIAGVAVRLR